MAIIFILKATGPRLGSKDAECFFEYNANFFLWNFWVGHVTKKVLCGEFPYIAIIPILKLRGREWAQKMRNFCVNVNVNFFWKICGHVT